MEKPVIHSDNQPSKTGNLVHITSKGERRVFSPSDLDLVFVIDTTGSMGDKIEALIATCQKLVDLLGQKNISWQAAVVGFGDLRVPGDKIVATSFLKNVEGVKRTLAKIPHFYGGNNHGESSLEALVKAMDLAGYNQGSIKAFIFMTDDFAVEEKFNAPQVTSMLLQREILAFVISYPVDYFQEMAEKTGGEWFPISADTNFLSVLDKLSRNLAETVVGVQEAGSVTDYLQLKGRD